MGKTYRNRWDDGFSNKKNKFKQRRQKARKKFYDKTSLMNSYIASEDQQIEMEEQDAHIYDRE